MCNAFSRVCTGMNHDTMCRVRCSNKSGECAVCGTNIADDTCSCFSAPSNLRRVFCNHPLSLGFDFQDTWKGMHAFEGVPSPRVEYENAGHDRRKNEVLYLTLTSVNTHASKLIKCPGASNFPRPIALKSSRWCH